jgi:5-methylcytosine-specific restriction protein B
MEKLEQQLHGAADETIQLAAEAIFFNYFCEADTGPQRKRKVVGDVLAWMAEPAEVPEELWPAFSVGIASIGQAKTQKWQQIAFLLEFMRAWKTLAHADKERLLDDPVAFRETVYQVPKHSASVQIDGLLHLVFPDDYETIVSQTVKHRVVEAFSEYLTGSERNVDEQLATIREAIEPEYGEGFGFYDSELAPRWQTPTDAPAPVGAWLVRGANNRALEADGENMLPAWFRDGFVSIGYPNATPFSVQADVEQIREELRKAQPGLRQGEVVRGSGIMKRFLAIEAGDLVVTPDGDKIYVARAVGDPYWSDEAESSALRREVEWLNVESPASRSALKESAPGRWSSLRTLLTVSDLSQHAQTVAGLVEGGDGVEPLPLKSVSELAARLTMSEDDVTRILGLVERKRQVIFYGPPGTGKTFVALQLARYLAGEAGRVQLVQFHASYSYEDFVEGYRPTIVDNLPSFRISDGPLRTLAAAAASAPKDRFVLVIDEINRGNVAKVFGELYFLLEYRNEHATLQYSGKEFQLPENLLVIGTMNTADRTIAILDAALRRRFYFVPFFPGRPPVNDLLRRWLRANRPALEWVADVVDRANGELADAHLAIGHSFFIDEALDERQVREIWQHAILPTIEEHYFGQPDRVRRFDLERLRSGEQEPLQGDQELTIGEIDDGELEPADLP